MHSRSLSQGECSIAHKHDQLLYRIDDELHMKNRRFSDHPAVTPSKSLTYATIELPYDLLKLGIFDKANIF